MKGQANGFRQIEMRLRRTTRKRRQEAGIALLIAIFILLLIGVVAIALVVSSGTESALAGNYRSSTNVYYAAVAGLEEVRARLRSNNPNSFNNTAPGFLPPPATPLGDCAPVYVRSEEHTSELQSRGHLVCRLLLEKKKTARILQFTHLY